MPKFFEVGKIAAPLWLTRLMRRRLSREIDAARKAVFATGADLSRRLETIRRLPTDSCPSEQLKEIVLEFQQIFDAEVRSLRRGAARIDLYGLGIAVAMVLSFLIMLVVGDDNSTTWWLFSAVDVRDDLLQALFAFSVTATMLFAYGDFVSTYPLRWFEGYAKRISVSAAPRGGDRVLVVAQHTLVARWS